MTDHPITPPPDLVQEWLSEFYGSPTAPVESTLHVTNRAAQWGANTELKACCALMDDWGLDGNDLMECRRPKPPSLKEQGLAALEDAGRKLPIGFSDQYGIIRRALEALPDD